MCQSVYRQFADFKLWMIWALSSHIRPGNETLIDQIRKAAYLIHRWAGISAWNRKSCVSRYVPLLHTLIQLFHEWKFTILDDSFRSFIQLVDDVLFFILHDWNSSFDRRSAFISLAERFSHYAMLVCYSFICWLCR